MEGRNLALKTRGGGREKPGTKGRGKYTFGEKRKDLKKRRNNKNGEQREPYAYVFILLRDLSITVLENVFLKSHVVLEKPLARPLNGVWDLSARGERICQQ